MMPDLDVGGPSPRTGIARWRSAERRYRTAAWNSWPSVVVRRPLGRVPLLITAPHAGPTMRNGWPKPADPGTGGLAEALAERHGAGLVAARGVQPDDPNWDLATGPFKQAVRDELQRQPALVLDLHAMLRETNTDICIGMGSAPDPMVRELAAMIVAMGERAGLRVSLDTPYAARNPGTITSFTQRLGHRALQIEINSRLLDLSGTASDATKFFSWISAVIQRSLEMVAQAPPVPPRPAGSAEQV